MDAQTLQAQGWEAFNPDDYSRSLGPRWVRREGDPAVGFFAAEAQVNAHMGTVHGAALTALADVALGFGVAKAAGTPLCATIQLNVHFVAAPRIGDFIHCRPEVTRVTSQIVFVRGLIQVGDRIVANADGIWKILTQR